MGVSQYETAINAATQYAFSSATQAAKVLSCVPTSATDTACPLSQVLGTFGRRAFRRPLTAADLTRYVSVATDIAKEPGGSILVGLKYAVSAILQSPEFLYRVELGAPSAADGGRNKYTDFEMASRLASLLWGSVPDEALLNAAASGKLSTAEGVLAQAKTMLASQKAHQAFANFANDLYGMDPSSETPLSDDVQRSEVLPQLDQDTARRHAARAVMRIDDVAFTGDYLSLYDSPVVFVNNELAQDLRPSPGGGGWVSPRDPSCRIAAGGASGQRARFSPSNGLPQRTSPTLRGRFVAQQLLCKAVPPPPPNVDTSVLDTLPPGSSVKADSRAHRKNAACAACHALMDPVGLGLENFDSVGAYRTTENNVADRRDRRARRRCLSRTRRRWHGVAKPPGGGVLLREQALRASAGAGATGGRRARRRELEQAVRDNGHRADQLLLDIVSSDAYRFVEIATK